MRTGKRLLVMLLIILLAGCGANMIRVPGETSQYAPMNDNPKRGVISYKANGPAWAVKARLEDAYKQMYELCNGKYIIINEDSQIAGAVAIPIGRVTAMPVVREAFVTFECVKDKQ
jgi:hypothetical protein